MATSTSTQSKAPVDQHTGAGFRDVEREVGALLAAARRIVLAEFGEDRDALIAATFDQLSFRVGADG